MIINKLPEHNSAPKTAQLHWLNTTTFHNLKKVND